MDLLKQYGVSQRFLAEFPACSEEQAARVIAQYRGGYKIVTADEERSAEISGRLRYDTEELAQYPTVGDYVTVTTESGSTRIRRVLTRKSLLSARPWARRDRHSLWRPMWISSFYVCLSIGISVSTVWSGTCPWPGTVEQRR